MTREDLGGSFLLLPDTEVLFEYFGYYQIDIISLISWEHPGAGAS